MADIKRFESGKSYFGRFVSNADRTVCVTIEERTPKMVKFSLHGERRSCKIKETPSSEFFRPLHGVTIDALREIQN